MVVARWAIGVIGLWSLGAFAAEKVAAYELCRDELISCREGCSIEFGTQASKRPNLVRCVSFCEEASLECEKRIVEDARKKEEERKLAEKNKPDLSLPRTRYPDEPPRPRFTPAPAPITDEAARLGAVLEEKPSPRQEPAASARSAPEPTPEPAAAPAVAAPVPTPPAPAAPSAPVVPTTRLRLGAAARKAAPPEAPSSSVASAPAPNPETKKSQGAPSKKKKERTRELSDLTEWDPRLP